MANSLRQQIDQISREKNINADVIIAAIEDAILMASKKYYKSAEDLRSRFNEESGQIEVFAVRQVVETVENDAMQISLDEARRLIPEAELGSEIEFPKPTDVLGRIAAQTAKQVIFQKVREAERDNVFSEYSGRVGEVINGIVKRQEMGDYVVDLGRAEAVLPRKEQSRAEAYQAGDRIRVAITKVMKAAKGPQIVVSRVDPALLMKLFEMEVPEIYDATVQIKGCVREAGERAKVAVISREKDVDPVGACVGMKGTRVQSIIRELRGEKIDIVEYSEDPVAFVEKALSPAKISRVTIIDPEQRIMEVVVEDKQLSLAIGKKGQNVRLAAKLVGWRIDIKSEEEKRQEVEAEMARMARIVDELKSLEGVGDKTIQKLIDAGVGGIAHLLEMSDDELCSIDSVGPKTVVKIREAAVVAKSMWDQRDAEEAARAAQAPVDGDATEDVVAQEPPAETAPVADAEQAEGASGDEGGAGPDGQR
ncbi:MAG: transcription termination factor NusA [Vicinamibacteria bacterium]|jgi:N utilization substance protein A|nr:transcription termination factor NusA [Vicinamibacteria bacterium]